MILSGLIQLAMVAQYVGSGHTIQGGRIVRVISGDRYELEAPINVSPTKIARKKMLVRLQAVRAPQQGEKGFDQARNWAIKMFRDNPEIGGRTFNGPGEFIEVDLYVGKRQPGAALHSLVGEIVQEGWARFDQRQVVDFFRTSPNFQPWKAGMLKLEAEARKARKGLWGSVWVSK